MGGNATFSGTTYQARLIAYVYVHILAQSPLGWLGAAADDTPLAVSGEVKGPGDDARIEFGESQSAIEVQVKHGLSGGSKLDEVIERVGSENNIQVVLAIDRTSSGTVRIGFKDDLERLRSGRTDGLRTETTRILGAMGSAAAGVLRRLYLVPIDLDHTHDPELKQVMQLLRSTLEDPSQANAAWGVLVTDAGDICARRLRRTRKDLVELLKASDIQTKPLARDERWLRQLDFSKQLIERRHAAAALTVLTRLEATIADLKLDPLVRYRLAQQRAATFLQLGRRDQALASAHRALDIDAKGIHALVIAAFATIGGGDLAAATALADRAVEAQPESALAWSAKAYMAAAAGLAMPTVPPAVEVSDYYRTALAQIAVDHNDWQRALDLTAGLIAETVRSPDVLLLRTDALLSVGEPTGDSADEARNNEAERLASELIEILADDTHPYTHRALVFRAIARRHLGRPLEGQADLDRARTIAADDPNAIGQAARWKIEAGDDQGAFEILCHPTVDRFPVLLVLRAQVLARRKEGTAARDDITSALRQITAAPDPDLLRFGAADSALLLEDADLAERILADVPITGTTDPRYALLRARIAFARGDHDAAIQLYEEAATLDPTQRVLYFAELGSRLRRLGHPAAAVKAFDTAGTHGLPEGALRHFVEALVEVNEFARAQEVVDRLAGTGSLPDWALNVAIDLALRQEDVAAAARHLSDLIEHGRPTIAARIQFAKCLIDLGRKEDAVPSLDLLAQSPELSPVHRMQVAQLMHAAGRPADAVALGFRAFRDGAEDPQVHRAFIVLAFMSRVPPPKVTEIGPDTYVRLRSGDALLREYTIFNDPPINRLQAQLSTTDADALGLLGKTVGDVIVQDSGTWKAQEWTVEEILPAIQHAVQDAMFHYEERFPGEPFLVAGFRIGDGSSVRDFAPIIASLEARKEATGQVFSRYREQTLPLGVVVSMLGGTIPDVMAQASTDPVNSGPLLVEWADREGQEESRRAAVGATEVVLTRSAIHTARALTLFGPLADVYTLVAPRSLYNELVEEVRRAEQLVADGLKSVGTGPSGLTVQELAPGHPDLIAQLDRVRGELDWLTQSARIENRPLETLGSEEEENRDLLGTSSYDAVAIARHRNATMYADDLGLRRFLPKGSAGRSFSSVGLVAALAERGKLTAEQRDAHLLLLVRAHYAFVAPTFELLEFAIRRRSEFPHAVLIEAFALLAGPSMTPAEASRIAARLMRASATALVQFMTIDALTRLSLDAMTTRWPASLCALTLNQAASEELSLLPQQLRTVQQTCSTFRDNALLLPQRSTNS